MHSFIHISGSTIRETRVIASQYNNRTKVIRARISELLQQKDFHVRAKRHETD